MRIYIAGPMTGYRSYNAPMFRRAKALWEEAGWDVVTPLDTNSLVWNRHFGRDFDPAVDVCDYGSPLMNDMFSENIRALTTARHMALLPGWQLSKGTAVEIAVARLLRFPIFYEALYPCAPSIEDVSKCSLTC